MPPAVKRRLVTLAAAASLCRRLFMLLLALCVCGCLYIPTSERGYEGIDLRKVLGGPASGAELRVGTSTREDVTRVLGSPLDDQSRIDAPVWVLSAPNVRGFVLVFAPPPAGPSRTRDYFASLHFDDHDVLSGFELRREREWSDAGVGMMVGSRQWLPPETWPDIETRTELVARRGPPVDSSGEGPPATR
jgi:hypothetical protein